MIKSLRITNYLGEEIKIKLSEDEPEHGLILFGADGIGSPKADINTTAMASFDGTIYNSARAEERNIVLKLLLTFAPKIEDSRQRTYQYFPLKKPVTLHFETDNREIKITGYVEENQPNIFTSQETVQISILCPDPFFYSEKPESTIFSGVEPMFEFIFSNESLEEPLLCFGEIRSQTEQTVHYNGDADVGVIIKIHAIGPVDNIDIYNVRTREHMRIDTAKVATLTGSGIVAGDDIIINTNKGSKSVQLLRGGKYTNILNCVDRDVDWFRLVKGDNIFAYVADSGSENLYFNITYDTLYEGV